MKIESGQSIGILNAYRTNESLSRGRQESENLLSGQLSADSSPRSELNPQDQVELSTEALEINNEPELLSSDSFPPDEPPTGGGDGNP